MCLDMAELRSSLSTRTKCRAIICWRERNAAQSRVHFNHLPHLLSISVSVRSHLRDYLPPISSYSYLTGPTCACIVKPLSSVERCDLAARAKETLRSPYQRNHAHKKNTRILDRCAAGVMANGQRAHASCAARYYGWLDHNIK